MNIIGYKQARELMQQGCKVLEVPQLRGLNQAFVQDQKGLLFKRIRADAWDKLRRECHLVERQYHGRRKQHVNTLWAYGALISWTCTYQHPQDGKIVKAIVWAVTVEEAEEKAKQQSEGWDLIEVMALSKEG